jgi:hypothetical protein
MAFGVAGAIPFVARGPRLLAQRVAVGSSRPSRDLVIEQLAREMARLYTEMKQRGMRVEQIHELAGQVRVMLAHARVARLDTRLMDGVGEAIDANGRDTMIDAERDERDVRLRLAAFGIDAPAGLEPRHLPREKRAEILDALLVSGVTPYLEQLDVAMAKAEEKATPLSTGIGLRPRALPVCNGGGWQGLIDMMSGAAQIADWCAPELAVWFWLSAGACEVGQYLECMGG